MFVQIHRRHLPSRDAHRDYNLNMGLCTVFFLDQLLRDFVFISVNLNLIRSDSAWMK